MIGGLAATLAGSVLPPGQFVDMTAGNANLRAGCAYSDRPVAFDGDLAAAESSSNATSLFKGTEPFFSNSLSPLFFDTKQDFLWLANHTNLPKLLVSQLCWSMCVFELDRYIGCHVTIPPYNSMLALLKGKDGTPVPAVSTTGYSVTVIGSPEPRAVDADGTSVPEFPTDTLPASELHNHASPCRTLYLYRHARLL
jgi:hypothetical protein